MIIPKRFLIDPTTSLSMARFLEPLHLLCYSALLGSTLYQSFIVTKICYRSLPRSAFVDLQKRLFPIYFRVQAVLLLVAALTIPPRGPFSLIAKRGNWIPYTIAGVATLLNVAVYGPRTRKIMLERVEQSERNLHPPKQSFKTGADRNTEIRDEGKLLDDVPVSDEMRELNRNFSRSHAMTIHLNLISLGAMLFWGFKLAMKLDFA
ncbi:hypothetical protein F4780DRAFT_728263 [Xylariomycetidae sp. FL0641]|nr:hypothetical protein F4780DRAFT_728263 [Xylariomycetidae sp. FL0641]